MADLSRFSLEGKTAIVTGGSTGIGYGIAQTLAEAGADVAVAARTVGQLEEAAKELRARGCRALAVPLDATKPDEWRRALEDVRREWGHVDILVNNAGGTSGTTFKSGLVEDLSIEDFEQCIAVNLESAYLGCKLVAPIMIEQGGGVIINVASGSGRESTPPMPGYVAYGAAKAGVVNMTTGMAVEFAPHIRVNCVSPGVIEVPRLAGRRSPEHIDAAVRTIAMGYMGDPQDIGWAAVFLASEAARWITGVCLDVNGGVKSTRTGLRGRNH